MLYRHSIVFIIFVITTFYAPNLHGQQMQAEIDSLKKLYQEQPDETAQIDILNDISYAYRRTASDSTLKYAEEAIRRSHIFHYQAGLAYGYKNKGIGKYKLGAEPDTVIYYYQKAIDYAIEIQDYYTQAACYNNIALVQIFNLSYSSAIANLLKGVAIFDEHIKEENQLKALIVGNLGTAYHRQGEHEKGIAYYEQTLAMADRIQIKFLHSIYVDELARAKMEIGKTEEAYQDVLNVLPLHHELGDLESLAESLMTLAEIECQLNKFELAAGHAQEAMEIAKTTNFPRKLAQSLVRLSQAKQGMGQVEEAITYAQRALEVSKEAEMHLFDAQVLIILSDLFAQKGEHEEALAYLRQYNVINESNLDKESKERAARLEANYQNRERQIQIDLLQKKQKTDENRIRLLWGTSIFFLLLLFISGYTYFQKWRTSKALNAKHNALTKAEQKLNEKNTQLQEYIASNLQLENFAHLASHDLREPMRTIVSFSQLLQKSAAKKLDSSELEYLQFIQEGTRRIESLINDLLIYAKIKNSQTVIEEVDANKVVDQVRHDLNRLTQDHEATIHQEHLPNSMLCDPAHLYQLFQNLISNAIKYGKQGQAPIVEIKYYMTEEFHHFTVSDNGRGIPVEFHERIFLLFKTLQNKSISNSSGIGLATCKKIIEQIGGKIWLRSEQGQGSTFFFIIPIKPEMSVV